MIRKIRPEDVLYTARVWHRSGLDEYTYTPFQELDEATAIEIFRNVILKNCDVWIYESGGAIAGFIAMKDSYVDRLYIDPKFQRSGIGTALLEYAKKLSPRGLELHTHQQNQRACRFYEKHGFVAVKFGISPPPESLPDVEYHWRPGDDA